MGTWGNDARRRFARHSLGAIRYFVGKIPIIGLLMLMAAAQLSTSGQAREVTVTVTGYMSSGKDTTGVFAPAGYLFGSDDVFNVVYSINDALGQPCDTEYSCIKQSTLSNPITSVTLMITGPGLPGNAFTFVNNEFSPTAIQELAYRFVQLGGSEVAFLEQESYEGGYADGAYNGGSWVHSSLTVDKSVLLNNCWEEDLQYPLMPGNSTPGSSDGFLISVGQFVPGLGERPKYVAQGYFNMKNISILPSPPPPPAQCFVGNSR